LLRPDRYIIVRNGQTGKAVQSEFGANAVKMVKHLIDFEPEATTDAV